MPSIATTLRVACAVLAATAVAVPAAGSKPSKKRKARQAQPALQVEVLSGRADLVTGGDALVAIRGVGSTKGLKVTAGKRNVTKAFGIAEDGTVAGLVEGLPLGRSTITARTAKRGARLVVHNHPIGGPVIAGPQLQPWRCQPTARDAQCNEPPTFRYVYKSTDPAKSGLQPYDRENPPSDVATTVTDQGVKMPFIVRVETGYIDRDQYRIATLYRPGEPWSALAPQRQFNRKVLITHGFACGIDHAVGSAPDVLGGAAETALARGFATMSTALDHAGHNCNLPLQAESLIMAKEHLQEHYGTLRYTIGTGCSGGSLTQYQVANAYPGIYQGILPTCSFPDAWSTATQFMDYHLMLAYFDAPGRWSTLWTPLEMAAVQDHLTPLNAFVSDNAQYQVVVPTHACAGVPAQDRYHPDTNPGGVRCSVLDAAINVLGPRERDVWLPEEHAIGRGFAGAPIDNIGVQYGLRALRARQITPEQFVDLNVKAGGVSMRDADIVPTRTRADRPALANAYRSGLINTASNLDRTAIIDCRGPDPGLFHDAYRAYAVRARLDREHGHHDNQVIWNGLAPVMGDLRCEKESFAAMDRWLSAVERDGRPGSVAEKIARNRPRDVGDRCYTGVGLKISDGLCPDLLMTKLGTPRMQAGDAITTDTNKCELKPHRREDYGGVTFTDAQWARLQAVFPDGVCDFSKPGVDRQPTIAWQTYQDRKGRVIYGGRPLGPEPRSTPLKAAKAKPKKAAKAKRRR